MRVEAIVMRAIERLSRLVAPKYDIILRQSAVTRKTLGLNLSQWMMRIQQQGKMPAS